jgi:hypothetical protein
MSEVDKGEIITAIIGLALLYFKAYLTYRLAKRKENLHLWLNWFSVLVVIEFLLLYSIGLMVATFDQSIPYRLVTSLVGFVYAYGMCLVFLLPFILLLWLYNFISWAYRRAKHN